MAFDPLAIFTGGSFDQAGQDTRDALAALRSQVAGYTGNAATSGIAALQSGQTGALSSLGTGFGQGRSDISGSIDPALSALYGGSDTAARALRTSQTGALGTLGAGVGGAIAAYNPLLAAAVNYGNYGDAAARALNDPTAFQRSPGYDWSVEQARQGAVRGANIAGGALSGNTLDAVTRLSSNLANQDYANWYNRTLQQAQLYSPLQANALSAYGTGVGGANLTGGTGGANIITGTGAKLSDLLSGTGGAAAGIYTGAGKDLANLATSAGTTAANVYTGTGGALAQLLSQLSGQQTQFAGQTVAPTAKSYEDQALGTYLGSQNLWNLGINAAKAASGAGIFDTPLTNPNKSWT